TGVVELLKVLALTDPTDTQAAYAADGQRLWLTVPRTPFDIDVKRAGDDTALTMDDPTFAEVSLRDPHGLNEDPDPLHHVKVAAAAPAGGAHAGPAVVWFGTT